MTGITDPSEEYFKDGLWAWVTDQWKKLVADASNFLQVNIAAQDIDVEVAQQTAADLTPGVMGWDGSQWRKLPLLWGYSDVLGMTWNAYNVAAGDGSASSSIVPAGEIWVVTGFTLWPTQANASELWMQAYVGGSNLLVKVIMSWTAKVSIEHTAPIYLKEDDYLKFSYKGAALNDDFFAYACGYKMKAAE